MSASTTNKYTKPAMALAGILGRAIAIHPDMTVSQLQVFLVTVAYPGLAQVEVTSRTARTKGGLSRTFAILTSVGQNTIKGLNLLKAGPPHASDRRTNNYILAARGEQLMNDIVSDMRGSLRGNS